MINGSPMHQQIDTLPDLIRAIVKPFDALAPRALWGGANVVDTLPKRTDLGELPNYRTHRHRLYGEQEGIYAGCDTHFPFKVMEVDHILPKSRGGTDHFENLQLLCTHCNKSKGNKTTAEWRATRPM